MRLNWLPLSQRLISRARSALRLTLSAPVLGAALLGSSALAQTNTAQTTTPPSGSFCTAVYGVGANGAITFFNTLNKTFVQVSTAPVSDINAAAVDKTTGLLYYIDRAASRLYRYDPTTQQHRIVGSFSPPAGVSGTQLVAGAFDENGTYYIYYDTGQFTTINKLNGAISGYRRITSSSPLASTSNGDLAFNGPDGYAIYETGSNRRSNLFRFNPATGVLSDPRPLSLNGNPVFSAVNGLAYEPFSGKFFASISNLYGGSGASDGLFEVNVVTGQLTLVTSIQNLTDLSSCSRPRPAAPTLSKSFNPQNVWVNPGISRLSITVGNPNSSPIYLTSDLIDSLPNSPAQMRVASVPNVGGTCPVGAVSAAAGSTSVILRNGTQIPASGCTVSVDVVAPQVGTYTNVIAPGALTTTVGSPSVPATAVLTVTGPSNLSLTKTADKTTVVAGGDVVFTLTVKNTGTSAGTNVVVRDQLPKGFAFVSATPAPASTAPTADGRATNLLFSVGTLAPNAQATITVRARGVAPAAISTPSFDAELNYRNIAEVFRNDTPDLNSTPGNCTSSTLTAEDDCASVRVAVTLPQTDLAVYKDVDLNNPDYPSRDPVISQYYRGDTVAYSYEAVNNGPSAADGATILDAPQVAGQLTYLSWTCTATGGAQCPAASGTGAPNLTLPKFPAGSKVVVRYLAVVNVVIDQLRNTVTITPPATVTDTNPANNSDTVWICAHLLPDLTLTKTSNGPWTVLQPGATYTLTVTNISSVPTGSAQTTVEDLLPVGIGAAFASGFSPAPGWTCTYPGEAEQGKGIGLTPFEGQRVLCQSSVSIPAGAAVNLTLPVNVTPTATATVFNRASVGKSNDSEPRPDPALCKKTSVPCAVDTTSVTPRLLPPAVCPVGSGTATNLLANPLTGYQDNDSATLETSGSLIANAANFAAGTGPNGSFVIDGTYTFNNGYGSLSKATRFELVVNGTVYATFLSEDGYSGRASVTSANDATLVGGASTLQLNRIGSSRIWVTLPSSVTSITGIKVKFVSSAASGQVADDYGFNVTGILGCFTPNPKAAVTKTVQNITTGGPVGTTGTGKPGEVLEYCIATFNTGNVGLINLGFGDNVPTNTTFKVGAYGTGRDIRVTYPTGDTFLTAAADADVGALTGGRVTVNPSSFVLAPGAKFTVCFRATIG